MVFAEPGHVTVQRGVATAMVENHRAAVTALPTGEGDTPVTRCPDRRTGAGGVIDALMGTHNAQDRVFARGGKPRTDARELDWHAQEAFLYRAAFVIVIRSEEHTSELQSLMRISYTVLCLKKNTKQ